MKTLRRIWFSLPFLAAAFVGLRALLAIFYEDVFGLNEAQRGFVVAGAEPFQLVGISLGIPIANRMLFEQPGHVLRFLGVAGSGHRRAVGRARGRAASCPVAI